MHKWQILFNDYLLLVEQLKNLQVTESILKKKIYQVKKNLQKELK